MLNPSSAARKIAAQVSPADPVVIRRAICPELLDLNRRGFLNGHTPFSAYLAFLGGVCQLLYGYSNVIVANERDAAIRVDLRGLTGAATIGEVTNMEELMDAAEREAE